MERAAAFHLLKAVTNSYALDLDRDVAGVRAAAASRTARAASAPVGAALGNEDSGLEHREAGFLDASRLRRGNRSSSLGILASAELQTGPHNQTFGLRSPECIGLVEHHDRVGDARALGQKIDQVEQAGGAGGGDRGQLLRLCTAGEQLAERGNEEPRLQLDGGPPFEQRLRAQSEAP